MEGGEKKKGLRNAFPSYIRQFHKQVFVLFVYVFLHGEQLWFYMESQESVRLNKSEIMHSEQKKYRIQLVKQSNKSNTYISLRYIDLKCLGLVLHISSSLFLLFTHFCIIRLEAKNFSLEKYIPRQSMR